MCSITHSTGIGSIFLVAAGSPLYDILCVVDDICRRNHIPYLLYAGTMLGAVRHGGFIPWDDDIDIIVWQKDYDFLCGRLRAELPAHLQLVQPADLAPGFYDYVTRVQDMRYYIHEPGEEDIFYGNRQNHACIDVLRFAYAGNTKWSVRWFVLLHRILYGFAMGHRFRIKSENYTFLQKTASAVCSAAGAWISMEKNIRWRERLVKRQGRKRKKYCISIDSPPFFGLSAAYESSWYDKTVYLTFRDRKLPVPEGYDRHLSLIYGSNYMVPVKDWDLYTQHFYVHEPDE